MFRLVDFAIDDHLTLQVEGSSWIGPLRVTYRVRERHRGTRLAVKLSVVHRLGALGSVLLRVGAIGDWIMMRKQLLTLKQYAERTQREEDEAAGRRVS